jgi:hypothetical protein
MSQEGEILVFHKDDNVDHERFVRVAQKYLGLVHHETLLATAEKKMFEDVWFTSDSSSAVSFVDDHYMDCQYLWVRGSQTPELVSQIYGLFSPQEAEEILEDLAAAHNDEEGISAILKLGVASLTCEHDPRLIRAFEFCLEEPPTPNPAFRRATIQAIAYSMWPENQPLLERVAQNDPDEGVRQFAQRIVNEYQERAASGS